MFIEESLSANSYKLLSSHLFKLLFVTPPPKQIPRDQLSQEAKNSLGSTLTVFRVDNWGDELESLLAGKEQTVSEPENNEEEVIKNDFVQKALTMIQDKVDKLDPW